MKIKAKTNKFGAAIHRLFNSKNKQHHVHGKATYFYENIQYIDEIRRQDFCQRITFPDHATVKLEDELFIIYLPTTIFMDKELIEYKIVYSLSTQKFNVYVRDDIELDNAEYGLSEFADLDQIFIDGMDTFVRSLVLCKGKQVEIDEGRKTDVPMKHTLGVLGADGKEENRLDRWYSRNCKGVMPFLHEHNNRTCAKCNRDLNRLDEAKKEPEVLELGDSVNDLPKFSCNSDTSTENLSSSADAMKTSDNDQSVEDDKVGIIFFLNNIAKQLYC